MSSAWASGWSSKLAAGVPAADGRPGAWGADARFAIAGVRANGAVDLELGPPGRAGAPAHRRYRRIPHRPGARRRAGQRRPHQLRPRRRLRHDRTPFEVGDPVDRFLSRKALEAWVEWGRPADEVQTLAFGQEPRCSATRSTGTGAASTPARARSCLAFFSMLSDIAGDLRSRSCDEGSNLVSALPCRPLDSAGDYWFGGPGSSL